MLKKTFLASLAICGFAFTNSFALSDDDFIEAAWMTTRFYGAQRSGQGPNWILDGTNNPTSFTGDKYNGKDVSGGWFDCGDHVMYGQSQGFASYVLALSFAEFTKGFYDLYTGDYTDYKASKDYTRKGGKPNKIRDLLEELRYEADFWVKAAIDDGHFVTVKGDGNKDHNKWVTAGAMSKLGNGDGGEPRDITATADDSFTPGMAAAMLAVMARIDPDESAREKYLKAAKTAFAYAKKHNGVTNSQGFYEKSWWQGIYADGPCLAAMELYRTTLDSSYAKEAKTYYDKIDFEKNSWTRLSYSDASPITYILGDFYFKWHPKGDLAGSETYLENMYNLPEDKDSKGIFLKDAKESGFPTRSPSGGAFLYALYAKFAKDKSYDSAIEKNIAYLLGDNSNKKSYVVGYTRNGVNAPTRPHHRGYYGNEDPGRDVNGVGSAPEKNKLLGGMIAGNFSSGSHDGNVSNWQVNEVCVDINAPLVGALGYILSKRAPVDSVESDVESPEEKKKREEEERKKKEEEEKKKNEGIISGRISSTNAFSLVRNTSSIMISSANNEPFKVHVYGLNGKLEQEIHSKGQSLNVNIQDKGLKIIKVMSKNANKTFKVGI